MTARLYAIVGAALAVLAFVAYLLWQLWGLSSALSSSEQGRIEATTALNIAVDANKANTAALATLAQNTALNNQLLTSMAGDLDKLRSDMNVVKANRDKLAQANPDVKAFLNTPVPTALRVRPSGN